MCVCVGGGGGETSKKTEFESTCGIVCIGELSFYFILFLSNFGGLGKINVTDDRRERIPLLWSTVERTALAKGFCSNM